jgi:hypothetical protein
MWDGGRSPLARWTVFVALAVPALALAPPADADVTDPVAALKQDPASVREYWTAERMREAVPIESLGGPLKARRGGTIARRVPHPAKRPARSHGKVFLTLGGTDYECSGTSVRAPAENVVWTAGHCVFDKPSLVGAPRFASNWMFAPGYRNGKRKFGRWVATGLTTTVQWSNCGLTSCSNFPHDLGAANVAKLGGKTLQDRVGGRRIQFDGPRDRTYKAIGYPAEGGFNGERMWGCRSPYSGSDSGNPPPMRITCDMTGGSSGGGWIAGGKLASVVSYGYESEPNRLYGPYQGAAAHDLYNQVKGG